jgi:hypothetical protein
MKSIFYLFLGWMFVIFSCAPSSWHPAATHTEITIMLAVCWICYEIAKLRESKCLTQK